MGGSSGFFSSSDGELLVFSAGLLRSRFPRIRSMEKVIRAARSSAGVPPSSSRVTSGVRLGREALASSAIGLPRRFSGAREKSHPRPVRNSKNNNNDRRPAFSFVTSETERPMPQHLALTPVHPHSTASKCPCQPATQLPNSITAYLRGKG